MDKNFVYCKKKHFVNSFDQLGLEQCITVSTRNKGKTLDTLFSRCIPLLSNLNKF